MLVKEHPPKNKHLTHFAMTYQAFLEWSVGNTHAEWVDGEVIVFMPPKRTHQTTLRFIAYLLASFTDLFNLGEVQVAPFEMKLSHSAREPDILFVANKNLARLTEDKLIGPADLVVEIASKSTAKNDKVDKFKEYELAGIAEYWIIDPRPEKKEANFYHLNKQGQYVLFATEKDKRVDSKILPGFWLNPNWLWQADKLNPLSIFFEIQGLSSEQAKQVRQMLSGKKK